MAFKFKCEHCGEELTVYYLKKGEEAQCTECGKQATVSETAEFLDLGIKPAPVSRLSLPIRQDEERRRECALEEIANSQPVKEITLILNVVWYLAIVFISLTVLGELVMGPNGAFYSDPTLDLAIDVRWDPPVGLVEGQEVWQSEETIILGHDNVLVHVPGGMWPVSVALDSILSAIVMLAIVFFLRRFFLAVVAGRPFGKGNSYNLRWVGYLVFFWDPFFNCVQIVQANAFFDELKIDGAQLSSSWSVDFKVLLLGLMIIAIAHILEFTARIQRENDLTI